MYADPPLSHPFLAAMSANGLSDLSQLVMGLLTLALPDHPQEPLQQSQYLVVFPEPDWASTVARPVASARRASCLNETMMIDLLVV
jgi:hypothetical protein